MLPAGAGHGVVDLGSQRGQKAVAEPRVAFSLYPAEGPAREDQDEEQGKHCFERGGKAQHVQRVLEVSGDAGAFAGVLAKTQKGKERHQQKQSDTFEQAIDDPDQQ